MKTTTTKKTARVTTASVKRIKDVSEENAPHATTGSPSSKYEHRHCCVLRSKYKDLYGEKTYRFRNLRK